MKNINGWIRAVRFVFVTCLSLGWAATGSAYQTGIVGLSGKSNGFYCKNCHAGGSLPLVALEGPTVVTPGSTSLFRFVVTSQNANQIVAGLDVAVSGGALGSIADQGTRLQLSEITHEAPKVNNGSGEAIFEFSWLAPEVEGTYTIYGAGVSANGNMLRTGDASARTTLDVVVGVNVPTPTPTLAPATPTATATPTGSADSCVGDCGIDGEVTVDEIIVGTNIALGLTPVSECLAFDSSGDQQVTVEEILQAVNNALTGCPL